MSEAHQQPADRATERLIVRVTTEGEEPKYLTWLGWISEGLAFREPCGPAVDAVRRFDSVREALRAIATEPPLPSSARVEVWTENLAACRWPPGGGSARTVLIPDAKALPLDCGHPRQIVRLGGNEDVLLPCATCHGASRYRFTIAPFPAQQGLDELEVERLSLVVPEDVAPIHGADEHGELRLWRMRSRPTCPARR